MFEPYFIEYNSEYNNFVFIGDYNVNVNEISMKEICNLNGLKSMINEPTCFKNPKKPTCIDLILTNRPTYIVCRGVQSPT